MPHGHTLKRAVPAALAIAAFAAAAACLPGSAAADFAPAPGSPVAVGAEPFWVASADFDGDGRVDLASANTEGTVSVLLRQPDGSYAQEDGSPIAVGRHPAAVATADFDADGRTDLAVSNFASNSVTILLRRAGGGFEEEAGSPIAAGPAPHSVLAADFNDDGRPDLALPDYGGAGVTVLLRRAGGGFEEADGSPVAAGDGPTQLAAADFDGDGRLDLAAANFVSDDLTILLGRPDGRFAPEEGSPIRVGADPVSPATADFNGDGRTDLAVTNQGADTVTVLLRGAGGGFTEQPGSPFPAGDGPYGLVVGDFDEDGRTDLAASNEHSGNVTVLLARAGGGYGPAPFSPVPVGRGPLQLAAADLDGDRRLDLVVPNRGDGTATVLLQRRPAVPIDRPGPVVTPSPIPRPGGVFAGPPQNLSRPTVVERSNGLLLCSPGTWRDLPSGAPLAYEWLIVDAPRPTAPGKTQIVSTEATFAQKPTLIGKEVACRVTARNGAGATSATSATWLLAKAGPVLVGDVYGNFRIRGIDIFQTVQPNSGAAMYDVPSGAFPVVFGGGTPTSSKIGEDHQRADYLGVPIDASKPAVATVYLDMTEPGSSKRALVVTLSARRNGRTIDGTQTRYVATPPPRSFTGWVTTAERDDPRYGVQFRVPARWLEHAATGDPLELVAEVKLESFASRYANRECAVGVACTADNVYRLSGVTSSWLFPLSLQAVELRGRNQAQGSLNAPDDVLARAMQLYPGGDGFAVGAYEGAIDVSALQEVDLDTGFVCVAFETVRDCRAGLIQTVVEAWAADYSRATYARPADVTVGIHRYRVGNAASNFEPGWTAAGTGTFTVNDGSAGRPLTAAAHEFGHVMGAVHASTGCGGGADDQIGESWPPDQMGRLQGVKFDNTSSHLNNLRVDPVVDGPSAVFDLMSYCAPETSAWLSARNWNRAFQWLTAHAALHPHEWRPPARARTASAATAAPADSAFATGVVGSRGGAITRIVVADGDDRIPASVPAADVRLRSLDANGRVLLDAGVEVHAADHAEDGAGTFVGPVTPAAAAVELVRDGTVLNRSERSRAPRVGRLAVRSRPGGDVRVRWAASDPDGDPLHATIDYSSDGGRSYRPLYTGPNRGNAVLDAAFMEGSRRARVRVSIDDGFSETRAVSALLQVAGTRPVVTIAGPRSGDDLRAGENSLLTGSAQDDGRRRLTRRALTWYAGAKRLGTGERLSARLPAGKVVLRLVARDRHGRTSEARRILRVQRAPLSLSRLRYAERVRAGTRTVSVQVQTSAAGTLRAGARRYAVGPRLRRIAVHLPARPVTGRVNVPFTLTPAAPGSGGKTLGTLTILRLTR